MKDLETKLAEMLEREHKRRDVALKYMYDFQDLMTQYDVLDILDGYEGAKSFKLCDGLYIGKIGNDETVLCTTDYLNSCYKTQVVNLIGKEFWSRVKGLLDNKHKIREALAKEDSDVDAIIREIEN